MPGGRASRDKGGLVFDLPNPPPANNLYQNAKRGRVKTPGYRAWLIEAGTELAMQQIGRKERRIEGEYVLSVSMQRSDKRRRDLGNTEKALSDLLVAHSVVSDDHKAAEIHLKWEGEGDRCRVEVRPI